MEQIALERFQVLLRAAMLESHAITHTCVLYQAVDTPILLDNRCNYLAAGVRLREFTRNPFALCTLGGEFLFNLSSRIGVTVDYRRNGAFLCASASDGSGDSFRAACDDDNLIFQSQLHGTQPFVHI